MDRKVNTAVNNGNRAKFFIQKIFNQSYRITPEYHVTSQKKKYLIVNGDDLCKDVNTNNAIITAYKSGILTSTSAFVNLEGSAEQLKQINKDNPQLPIGLHLNLTLGSPVTDAEAVPHLTDRNGFFYDIDNILKHLHAIPVGEVRKELHAQAERFISTGVPLDHINYHHHLAALYTPFFKAVREIALKYKVPVRNPVPSSIYKLIHLNGNGGGGTTGIRKLIQFGLAHPFKLLPIIKKVRPLAILEQEKLLQSEGISSTNWFIDSFWSNASSKNLISILEQLPSGVSEMMCHPGNGPELDVLTDPAVIQTVKNLQIELISWKNISEL